MEKKLSPSWGLLGIWGATFRSPVAWSSLVICGNFWQRCTRQRVARWSLCHWGGSESRPGGVSRYLAPLGRRERCLGTTGPVFESQLAIEGRVRDVTLPPPLLLPRGLHQNVAKFGCNCPVGSKNDKCGNIWNMRSSSTVESGYSHHFATQWLSSMYFCHSPS